MARTCKNCGSPVTGYSDYCGGLACEASRQEPTEEEEIDPDCPHHPDAGCPYCIDYWNRMRDEGLWIDGWGWTEKALKGWLN